MCLCGKLHIRISRWAMSPRLYQTQKAGVNRRLNVTKPFLPVSGCLAAHSSIAGFRIADRIIRTRMLVREEDFRGKFGSGIRARWFLVYPAVWAISCSPEFTESWYVRARRLSRLRRYFANLSSCRSCHFKCSARFSNNSDRPAAIQYQSLSKVKMRCNSSKSAIASCFGSSPKALPKRHSNSPKSSIAKLPVEALIKHDAV